MAAICANPEDDTPRLVYADWLDDNGRPERAEFIRVQVELARLDGDDPRRPDLDRREDELLSRYATGWLLEVPVWARRQAVFRRGFVQHTATGARSFAAKAGGLLAKTPLTSAYISAADHIGLQHLGGSRHLSTLTDLCLDGCEIQSLRVLTDSYYAAGLVSLTLNDPTYGIGLASLSPLVNSRRFSQYTRLGFRRIGFTAGDLHRFCDRLRPGQLDALGLESVGGADDGIRQLAASDRFGGLRSLSLAGCHGLTDDTLWVIGQSPHFRTLRRLVLANARSVTDHGMRGLAETPYLRDLTDLDLTDTEVRPAGIRALAESPNLPSLSRVAVRYGLELVGDIPIYHRLYPASTTHGTVWVPDLRR